MKIIISQCMVFSFLQDISGIFLRIMYIFNAVLIDIAFITVYNYLNNIFSASFCDKSHQFTEGSYLTLYSQLFVL